MSSKRCTKGNKKMAKMVRGLDGKMHCVRYGSPTMSIKKHLPDRKRSFCARHKCHLKRDPATPGFQSCKAWNCSTGRGAKQPTYRRGQTRRKTSRRRSNGRTTTRRKTATTRPRQRRSKTRKGTRGRGSPCSPGYERVPGTKKYSRGSCRRKR